jgi:uncharacterized protein YigA (DUF484 family)
MTYKAPSGTIEDREIERMVVEYLSDNITFLSRHPELLAQLEIPHQSGTAISLIERQVETLRHQLRKSQNQLTGLIEVARNNELLQERMHRLTLELIDAATFEEVLNALEDELHDNFKADAVELRLFSPGLFEEKHDGMDEQLARFEAFFDQNMPICGKMDQHQLDYIFGAEGDRIVSTALIPLRCEGVLGLLAIGSHDPLRFVPDQGTDFLTRLGEIISRTLQAVSLPGL